MKGEVRKNNMNQIAIQARITRHKKEVRHKILILLVILFSLILLMVGQTLLWLINNPPPEPAWFHKEIIYEYTYK